MKMRSDEILFFRKVKGKKIRLNTHRRGYYFIPEELLDDGRMRGKDHKADSVFCYIFNGFETHGINNVHWEFFEKVKGKKKAKKAQEKGKKNISPGLQRLLKELSKFEGNVDGFLKELEKMKFDNTWSVPYIGRSKCSKKKIAVRKTAKVKGGKKK